MIGDSTSALFAEIVVIFFYTFFEFLIFFKVNFSDLLGFLVAQNFIFFLDLQDDPEFSAYSLKHSAGVDSVKSLSSICTYVCMYACTGDFKML